MASLIETQVLLGSSHNDSPSLPEIEANIDHYDQDEEEEEEEEEEFISDDSEDDGVRHRMTMKEYRKYSKQIKESDGFDVDSIPNLLMLGLILPMDDINERKFDIDKIIRCAKLSLADYNTKNVTDWKFSKFIKANGQVLDGLRYYITFEVKREGDTRPRSCGDDYSSLSQVFQAMVMTKSRNVELELCRPKPTH